MDVTAHYVLLEIGTSGILHETAVNGSVATTAQLKESVPVGEQDKEARFAALPRKLRGTSPPGNASAIADTLRCNTTIVLASHFLCCLFDLYVHRFLLALPDIWFKTHAGTVSLASLHVCALGNARLGHHAHQTLRSSLMAIKNEQSLEPSLVLLFRV